MNETPITSLNCTQCGGELHPDEGQRFLTCSFCGATVYLDPSQVVFHYYLVSTFIPEQAAGELNRWMSGNQTVKDLDKKARIIDQSFQYFPIWNFLVSRNNIETPVLEVGAATSVTELNRLNLPAGDLKPYDSSIESQAVPPTIPLDTARGWLMGKYNDAQIRQSSLVHIPIYIFHYAYRNKTYTALVEAGTGSVMANLFPAKAEAPYLLAGGLTAIVYLCLALIALGGFQAGALYIDAGIAFLIAVIAAPFLFIFAVLIASRV
jgi:hypothetical protein